MVRIKSIGICMCGAYKSIVICMCGAYKVYWDMYVWYV